MSNKTIVDQYGNAFRGDKAIYEKMELDILKDKMEVMKQSTFEQMKAQAAIIQRKAITKELSKEYVSQTGTIREHLSIIQAKLQSEGKLTAEEIKQTGQLKEQLDVLKYQTHIDIQDRESKSYTDGSVSLFTDAEKLDAVKKAFNKIIPIVKDVEMGMVEIQGVMNDSSFTFDGYRDSLLKLGVDYGQTFDNVKSIAVRWAESGYDVADSLKLTETSLLALNTTKLNTNQSTEAMIDIMDKWNLQAEDMALVFDKINIVADKNSITSGDLIDGLLHSSSAAKSMNLSLDETIGLLTVMSETSGSTGKEIGDSMLSILKYIQRSDSIKMLENSGIDIFADTAKTQLRNVLDIFDEISSKWDSLSTDMQDGLMESANGIDFIDKLAGVQGVLTDMIDAEGYSIRKNTDAMDTLEKKMESLKAATEQLAVSIGDSGLGDALEGMIVAGTNAIEIINGLSKPIRDFVLATTTVFTAFKSLEWGMETFGIKLPGIYQMITSLTSGTMSLTAAIKSGAAGISTFATVNAPLLALSAAVGGIMVVTNSIKRYREEQEKAIGLFSQQRDIYGQINDIIPIYENLAKKTSLIAEEEQKLIETKEKIISLLPESKKFIEDENISLEEQIGIIQDLNQVELDRLLINAQRVINDNSQSYEGDKKRLEEVNVLYEENFQLLKDLQRLELKISEGDKTPYLSPEQMEQLKALPTVLEDLAAESDILSQKTTAYENAMKTINMLSEDIEKNADDVEVLSKKYGVAEEEMKGLMEFFGKTSEKVSVYNGILAELNSREGLSVKSKRDIISKYEELLPYLSDEQELRKKLIEIIQDEEKTQHTAYIDMLMGSENFFNAKIKGNDTLYKILGEFYVEDLKKAKSLAEAKEIVETSLIKNLSGKWAEYYHAASSNILAEADYRKKLSVGHGTAERQAYMRTAINTIDQQREAAKRFNKLVNEFSNGVDFSGVNITGFKSSSGGSSSSFNDNRQFLETIDAEIRAIKIKNDSLEKSGKLSQEQVSSVKDTGSIEGLNRQYELTGKLIVHNTQLLMSFKNEQDMVHKMANDIRDAYSNYDIDSWFDSNGEMTTSYIKSFNMASKEEQDIMQKIFDQVQKLKRSWMESASEVEKISYNVKELSLSQEKLIVQMDDYLKQQREAARTNWIKEKNDELKKQREQLQAVQAIEDVVVNIIRKRGEEEKKILDENHKSEMDSLEKRYQKRKQRYQDELDSFKKLIQDKLDALDEQYEEEDYLEQLKKEREEANRLQQEINILSLDDSLVARNNAIELRKQLADQNDKIAKLQGDKERELLKKSLQDQLKGYEQSVADKESIADRTYDNERKRIEEDYNINKEYLDKKYSDELIYAEAKEAIIYNQVEVSKGMFMDIYDAYQDFEDKFGKGMGILGGIIKKDFLDQLHEAQSAIDEMKRTGKELTRPREDYDSDYEPLEHERDYVDSRDKKSNFNNDGIYMSKSDFETYKNYKAIYDMAKKSGDKARMYAVSELAQKIRDKYEILEDKYSYDDLKDKSYRNVRFRKGGITESTGWHWLDGIRGEPERVLSAEQTKSYDRFVFVDMPKLQGILKTMEVGASIHGYKSSSLSGNILPGSGTTIQIDSLINVEGNVTKDTVPLIRMAGEGILENLKTALNSKGINRPLNSI